MRNTSWGAVTYGFFRPFIQTLTGYLTKRWKGVEEEGDIKTIFDTKYFFIAELSFLALISIVQSYHCLKAIKDRKKKVKVEE